DAGVGGQPVVQLPLGTVGGGRRPDDGVEVVEQRVALVGDGLIGGGHILHPQQPQPRLAVHLVDVVVDRKADGAGAVVVGGDAVHKAAHAGGGQLGGGVHQCAAGDQQLFKQGLAAAVLAPLEGHDGRV